MKVSAPAKLNLCLHITGKRDDGYHFIESLVAFSEFGDELEIEAAEKLSLDIMGEFASGLDKENNLVIRAARLLQQHAGKELGAKITLRKNIPVAAGLGGGSADAAAAMRALCELWDLDIHEKALAQMALALGSDVPACIMQKPAWLLGIGEKIEPVEIASDIWLVLVNPRKQLATADIYKAYAGVHRGQLKRAAKIENLSQLVDIIRGSHNDLQTVAEKIQPAVVDVIKAIAAGGALVSRMSGSGATCFGIYNNELAAAAAKMEITKNNPGWWAVSSKIARSS